MAHSINLDLHSVLNSKRLPWKRTIWVSTLIKFSSLSVLVTFPVAETQDSTSTTYRGGGLIASWLQGFSPWLANLKSRITGRGELWRKFAQFLATGKQSRGTASERKDSRTSYSSQGYTFKTHWDTAPKPSKLPQALPSHSLSCLNAYALIKRTIVCPIYFYQSFSCTISSYDWLIISFFFSHKTWLNPRTRITNHVLYYVIIL